MRIPYPLNNEIYDILFKHQSYFACFYKNQNHLNLKSEMPLKYLIKVLGTKCFECVCKVSICNIHQMFDPLNIGRDLVSIDLPHIVKNILVTNHVGELLGPVRSNFQPVPIFVMVILPLGCKGILKVKEVKI